MKSLLLFGMGMFLLFYSYGQQISNINFAEIEEQTLDSSSSFFYPKLVARLASFDTTLSLEDFTHLYFGNVYTEAYNPYGESEYHEDFLQAYREGRFKEAITFGKKILAENPVNIKITLRMAVCYHSIDQLDTAKLYGFQYAHFLLSILSSGDGASTETAFVVIKIADEYTLMDDMGLTATSQSLISDPTNGPTDLMTISKKGQKKRKGKKKIKALYFNVSQPFVYLSKQFQKDD